MGPTLLFFLLVIELGILTGLPFFVVMRRRHVHAAVHPVCFTSMERAPCVIIFIGAAHCGPDILEEPLAKLPGTAFICGGFGIDGILLARGFLGVTVLLEVGHQGNELGLVVGDRLVPHSRVIVLCVQGREVNDALRHVKRQRSLDPLGPLCLDVV